MFEKMFGFGAACSLLALAACGGSVQDIGDASSGKGGTGNVAAPGGGSSSSSPNGSGRGGDAWAPGPCDPPCGEGYGCYDSGSDPAGFCAPFCSTESDQQGQTADADLSCSNSVRGGTGTCVVTLGYGWPYPGWQERQGPDLGSNVVTGLCSNACDPIEQDCPAGYTCDMTDTYSAVAQQGLYACMPNEVPHALGDHCESTGTGECGPGLTCTLPEEGNVAFASCTAYCDRRDPDACPDGQTCTDTVITLQVINEPNIGVCL